MNLIKHSKEQPFHVSVGALITNDKGEICTHYIKGPWGDGIEDTYVLMRETPEPGERFEDTVRRGIMEEFGAEGEIIRYLGSIQAYFPRWETLVEKTTLYFHVVCKSIDPKKRSDEDVEYDAETRWVKPEQLIQLMDAQQVRYERTDLCESKIVKAYLNSM